MREPKQIKAQEIFSTHHVIKFFDDERYAKDLLRTGEMLFRTIKSFKVSKQPGRGDKKDIGIYECVQFSCNHSKYKIQQ